MTNPLPHCASHHPFYQEYPPCPIIRLNSANVDGELLKKMCCTICLTFCWGLLAESWETGATTTASATNVVGALPPSSFSPEKGSQCRITDLETLVARFRLPVMPRRAVPPKQSPRTTAPAAFQKLWGHVVPFLSLRKSKISTFETANCSVKFYKPLHADRSRNAR